MVVLTGAFRPAMRDCARSMEAAAPRPAVTVCHGGEMACCHHAAAPVKRGCAGMACCMAQDSRISVEGLSTVPQLHGECIVTMAAASAVEVAPFVAVASSPPPGGSNQEGFLSASSLRGPPVLA